jgi:putative ABC transport system permease protein
MPEWRQEIRRRLANLKLEPMREAAIIEELSQHLDDCYAESLAGGATPAEAELRTLAELSESEIFERELRRVERQAAQEPIVLGTNRRSNMIADLWQDMRYGARMLIKQPGFTTIAALTLALGIGANAAIFSVVNSVLLRPLAVAQPERLVRIGRRTSFPNYRDLADGSEAFSAVAAHSVGQFNLGQGDAMSRVMGELVTGNYFPTLGVHAALGRTFGTETDGAPGANPVAVVSHRLWRRRFGADAGLVGQTIVVNGRQCTVIGVMPEGFHGTWPLGWAPEIWVPATMQPSLRPGADRFGDRGNAWLEVFGRMKPGVSPAQAQAAVSLVTKRLADTYPKENRGIELTEVYPLGEVRGANFLRVIPVFLGLVTVIAGLVLLIACANVANLLLARAVRRRQEVAIRLALGASRLRLIRQLLTESVMLGLAGGAAGCLLAVWLTNLLRSFHPPTPVPIEINATLDVRVLGFTLAVSVLSGALFGLAPAWYASKLDLIPMLKDDGRTGGGRTARFSLRNLLVVSQVAVSLLLLICAGLFIRSLGQAQSLDPGFETERALTVPLDLESVGYDEARGRLFYPQLLDHVERVPGVQSASLAQHIPLMLSRNSYVVAVEGYEATPGDYPLIDSNTVGPRYFETMDIPIIAGREFNRQDGQGAPFVVIINEMMARRFWAGTQSALGRRLRFPGRDNTFTPYYEVVGVVKDSKYGSPGEQPKSYFYLSSLQHHVQSQVLHVRTMGEPNLLRSALRDRILALDKGLLVEVATMRENLVMAFFPARVAAWLLGLFGLLGLSLAVVGIYGVISYSVSQRTGEIGLRMALGAESRDILRLVIGKGMALTLIGVGLGGAVALALTRFLSSLLVGVSATDPLTFLVVSLLLTFVALLAALVPARRATKVDPLVALRHE